MHKVSFWKLYALFMCAFHTQQLGGESPLQAWEYYQGKHRSGDDKTVKAITENPYLQ